MEIELTTNHPKSSYNVPVAIVNGVAYGPDDAINGLPIGSMVAIATDHKSTTENVALALRFVRQSPANGPRWESTIKAQVNALPAEYPDEGDVA